MSTIDKRLSILEQREQASRGIRVFQQDFDDQSIFYEGMEQQGKQLTEADIANLAAAGWLCITVVYGETEAPNEY